jgi:uncharacterized protein YbcI
MTTSLPMAIINSVPTRPERDLEEGGAAEPTLDGELNAAIARAVVGIYRDVAGRGPTRARVFFRDDVLVVVLRDVLTTGERSMVLAGCTDSVRATRGGLQDVMHDALIAAVERLSGCAVEMLLSSTQAETGFAAQVFLLDRPVQARQRMDLHGAT